MRLPSLTILLNCAASVAAKKDLSPTFVKKWRPQLTPAQKEALQNIDWAGADLKAGTISSTIKG
jgi:hypothetical protein